MIRRVLIIVILAVMTLRQTEVNAIGSEANIVVAGKIFTITLYDNTTATAFKSMLPITVNMNELNGNEKYYYLSENLPVSTHYMGTINSGDIMLYGSNCLVLFYKTFQSPYNYTKVGHVNNVEGLATALGSSTVAITFKLILPNTTPTQEESSIRIYPIPTNSSLTIDGRFEKLTLFDTNGNIITMSNSSPLMMDNIKSGVYFLKIATGKNISIHKIIKK